MNYFLSDVMLFDKKIFDLIQMKNIPGIIEKVHLKHKVEIEDDKNIRYKKNDLLIWNAVLSKEIIKMGVIKNSIHPIYNKYYSKILSTNNLEDLQALELLMFKTYIQNMIYDLEITENYCVNKILQYIYLNIENHISLRKISKALNLSEGYISSTFHEVMNVSLMYYVRKAKINRAKQYLQTNEYSISELSDLLGFHDPSHFSKVFKSLTGVSPSTYRKKIRYTIEKNNMNNL